MDKEDIKISDWHRLLIGDNPWLFTVEVLGRTIVIYVCLMIVMRLLGKRMNAQLTIMDLAVMLTLGAIASVPMQAFDRGILPGIILLLAILVLHQASTFLIYKKRKMEILTQGKATLVVKNGVVDPQKLVKMRISKDQLFSVLRTKGVRHLGEVKRLYSESDGHFSLFKFDEPIPGLSILPRSENSLPVKDTLEKDNLACVYCGKVIDREEISIKECVNCKNKDWVTAMK